jgi:hypothetical protein
LCLAAIPVGLAAAPDKFKTTNLGSGIKIDLPKSWDLFRFPNMMGSSAALRELGAETSEWRAETPTLKLGVTYLFFFNPRGPEVSQEAIQRREETFKRSATQYLPAAIETEVTIERFANGSISGNYATFHVREGASFPVFAGQAFKCVTTATAWRGMATAIISVGSADCESDEHRIAVAAITGLHE